MNKVLCLLIVLTITVSCRENREVIKEKIFLSAVKQEILKEKIPGCAIVVIKNGNLIISESIGESDVAFSVPVNDKTIFSINSIAKIFAATAIMQLIEEGKMNASNPISDYLDGLPSEWQMVSVRQLLSHTSGLPDIEDVVNGGLIGRKGDDFAWNKVKTEPLRFKAGEKFNYNATNYLLIQKIIEKVSGLKYEEFLQKKQFNNIEINNIVFGNSFDVLII